MSTHRQLIALAALLTSTATLAAPPRLDPLFTNGAVLQRDRPIRISGDAAAGERVRVSLSGATAAARADRSGRWSVELPPLSAGGPHRIEARFASGVSAAANDVLIGDVWLCSGQSNMEWPVKQALSGAAEAEGARDEEMRLLTVPQKTALTPQRRFDEAPSWARLTPETAADFSAACYFMVRDLRATHKVPIGAIDASWGGTRIRPWMDEAAARASGGDADAALLALYRRDPAAGARRFGEQWGAWWRERTGEAPGQEPWRASDRLQWRPLTTIAPWEQWGDPAFASFNGHVWARRRVTLTPAEARKGATLSLGVIDDLDQTWVNGVGVGSTFSWSQRREHRVAPGVLRAGENEIIVNIGDSWGLGGFQGPAERLKLTLADGSVKRLREGWEYSVVPAAVGVTPRAPWDTHAGLGTIHNAMIAPLGALSLKGVAWYQGESDVGVSGYDRRLLALMSSWRRQFGDPQLPFLVVALAGFGKPAAQPADSGWAALIDAQRRAAAADPRAALVVATDLGERADIHPPNKQEVGRRLALAARRLAYREANVAAGIVPVAGARSGNEVHVGIAGTDAALQSLSGAPVGFELCGERQESCRYATATLAASAPVVVVQLDGKPATRVRHGWSDYPILNVVDDALLPLPPFELPIKD
ncbi:sialate O-acetylesterase [uncultured Sphingomonas sp.]|uniref:sialate O-acetylesterase n=1 Tax=uncultured Sphingomonas sp. TaxID=158754 RepID=UPI0026003543|nr:sialate O-acetylesterase [uncultured Sphingomonas sp.]